MISLRLHLYESEICGCCKRNDVMKSMKAPVGVSTVVLPTLVFTQQMVCFMFALAQYSCD